MLSHPDYPSLLCLTDTLQELGIQYQALKVEKEKIYELSFPLLAFLQNKRRGSFEVIRSLQSISGNEQEGFFKNWNGIVLHLPEKSVIQNEDHEKELHHEKLQATVRAISVIALLLFLFGVSYKISGMHFWLPLALNLIGAFISYLIFLHLNGNDTAITKQFCGAETEDCDKVLKSKGGKIFGKISWGEIGIIYFAANSLFLFLPALGISSAGILTLSAAISFLAVAGSLISVYYQWRVVRSWCSMCLICMLMVWLIAIFFYVNISGTGLSVSVFFTRLLSISVSGSLLILYVIVSLVWINISQTIKQNAEADKAQIQHLKLKRNPKLFLPFLYSQKKVDTTPWPDDIVLGNPFAPIQMMIACNPYCKPCAKTHKEFESIINLYPKQVGITIRFTADSIESESKKNTALRHILSVCTNGNEYHGNHPIDDWFNLMNLDEWIQHHPHDLIDEADQLLKMHNAWSRNAGINRTPTVFINGFEMAQPYTVKDLKMLLPQMEIEFELKAETQTVLQ